MMLSPASLPFRFLAAFFVAYFVLAVAVAARAQTFYMGADISLETFMQQQNKRFRDNGVQKPVDQVLYDHGANLFRLRLFVNPATSYTSANAGAIQSLSYDIALAQQIKSHAPTAKLLIDFQYSDSFADPGNQTTPAAWAGQSLALMEDTVRSYTSSALTAFRSAGVLPDMVQLGNEINSGMLWDNGKLDFTGSTAQQQASWQNLGGLLNSAIAGVRDAQGTGPKIDIALHVGSGSGVAPFFFSRLTSPAYGNVSASSFDVMGVSYYPDAANSLAALNSDLTSLVNSFNKPTMVLETNAPWESTNAPASDPTYADTPVGQLQFLLDLRQMMQSLPNHNGLGIVYWYPEAVLVNGFNIYNGGSTALFDNSGNALPALAAFSVPEPGAFCLAALGGAMACALRRKIANRSPAVGGSTLITARSG